MTPIQSREDVASTIASGIARAAGSIHQLIPSRWMDQVSIQETVQLQRKFQKKPIMQPQLVVC